MRCLLLTLALTQTALPAAGAGMANDAVEAIQNSASHYLTQSATQAYPGSRAKVEVGPIDNHLGLASCTEPDFFLPTGSRLWGNGNLGVQCGGVSPLTFYLTYRIRLDGPALLARRPLPVGYAPLPADLIRGDIHYRYEPSRYPLDPANLHDARLLAPLAKNAPLTIDMLRAATLIKAGQRVLIQSDGPGFQVTQEGVAQQQAGAGDLLRLKLSSGRYVQGVVRNDGTIYIKP